MIGIEIDRHFNDDILYPSMIYEVYLVPLRPEQIKSKTMEYEDYFMEEYAVSKEEWDGMSPREKLFMEYNIEAGNEARFKMNNAIDFMSKVDENIIPKDEKKKILKKMEKALMEFTYPFSLNLNFKV